MEEQKNISDELKQEPVAPVEPVNPAETVTPVEPINPIETVTPVEPAKSIETLDPVGPVPFDEPDKMATPVSPVPLKKKTTLFEILVVILFFLIAGVLALYYFVNQNNNNQSNGNQTVQPTQTDNQTVVITPGALDMETIAPFQQADTVITDNVASETQNFFDQSLGIFLEVPSFMSFEKTDNNYLFNYNGQYTVSGTDQDQDNLSIWIYRDLKLTTPVQSNEIAFNKIWEHTQELKNIGGTDLQVFKYIGSGASQLNCKLYLFNANNEKVGGLCFNVSRRLVSPADGGIAGDSAQKVATDNANYNAILDTVMKSVKFTK